ncbi:hypothetical protein ACFSKL_17975 [Belliella marina]|uniref:Uncharacterized protein n=1 Tax=Belliella marina TaxID=1644146 RepID=A0ABW4VRG6_9BACT
MKEHRKEGQLAKEIEKRTAQIPSDIFLWSSVSAMGVSLALKAIGKSSTALFVGQWAAPFLLVGIYNKIVKTTGSDKED